MLQWNGRGVAVKRTKGADKKVVNEIIVHNGEEIPENFFTEKRLKKMMDKKKVIEVGVKKPHIPVDVPQEPKAKDDKK